MPKEKVSYSPVGQCSLKQEGGEVTVQVGLILQDLHQLDEVLQKFIITVYRKTSVKVQTEPCHDTETMWTFVYLSFLRHLMVNERTAGSGKL